MEKVDYKPYEMFPTQASSDNLTTTTSITSKRKKEKLKHNAKIIEEVSLQP